MTDRKYLTVSALNKYIAYKFDQDTHLSQIFIRGEISNFRESKGHWYFVLKDEESEIAAVAFSSSTKRVTFVPKDGITVFIVGNVTVYQKKGTYNLTVYEMQETGVGLLHQLFLQLKEKLQKEGLFDSKHKQEISEFNDNIAVITSPTGDAYFDIVSTINKRYPLATIYLYPALVQGEEAPISIIKALQKANSDKIADVIIIARGGGSSEDLSCFNDETLAREIFHSNIPIISGVGHESDYTICDFVSDYRAPTPTGAAVKATPDKMILLQRIDSIENKMYSIFRKTIMVQEHTFNQLIEKYHFKHFLSLLELKDRDLMSISKRLSDYSPLKSIERSSEAVLNYNTRLQLINLPKQIDLLLDTTKRTQNRLDSHVKKILNQKYINLIQLIERLNISNPLTIMEKGYTLVYQESTLRKSINELNIDIPMEVRFHDGVAVVTIKETKKGVK